MVITLWASVDRHAAVVMTSRSGRLCDDNAAAGIICKWYSPRRHASRVTLHFGEEGTVQVCWRSSTPRTISSSVRATARAKGGI